MSKNVANVVTLVSTVLLILLIVFTSSCGLAARSAYGVAQRTLDPDKIIGDYHWFEDQYGVIKSMGFNIEQKQAEFNSMENGDARERMRMELSGMKAVYSRNVQEYNSKSRQIDRVLWKSKDLPYEITQ